MPITIPKGGTVAEMELLPDDLIAAVATTPSEQKLDVSNDHQKMVEKAKDRLSREEKEQLYALLLQYNIVFFQAPYDCGRTRKI